MTGLLIKDMLVSLKTLKAYATVMGFYVLMALLDIFQLGFAASFISIMMVMLPIGAFSYDEAAKWDRYAMSLPLKRSQIVAGRYLYTLVVVLAALAFTCFASLLLSQVKDVNLLETLSSAVVSAGIGLLIADILLPLSYRLGPERARPFLYAVVFVPLIALFLAARAGLFGAVDLSWLDRLVDSSPAAVLGVFSLVPLLGFAGMLVSYLISCRILVRKEV